MARGGIRRGAAQAEPPPTCEKVPSEKLIDFCN